MLKQTIEYTDFDENPVTETLYFNVTKTELSENLHLKDEIDEIQQMLGGEERELTPDEIQTVLNMVKKLMKLSYGIRSDDGKRFIKGDQIWEEFTQTAAYDAFLFSLFEKPENAVSFMFGIIPADLRAEVMSATEGGSVLTQPQREVNTVELPTAEPVLEDISDEDLLKMDPKDMTQAQLMRAFQLKSQSK
jgi:hypothetical protein